jgi:hypothetical protein
MKSKEDTFTPAPSAKANAKSKFAHARDEYKRNGAAATIAAQIVDRNDLKYDMSAPFGLRFSG